MTDASKSQWLDDLCWRTRRRPLQPTSHPRAPTSAPPRGSARAPSTQTSSNAQYARAEEVLTNATPRSPGAWLTWSLHTWVPRSAVKQTIPGPPREPQPAAQPEGARMDIVFNLDGQTYYIDTAVITPFSANAGLISAASARPGHMAKREEKKKFDRTSRINLAPVILETTGRPGYHAQKFIKHLFSSDTDHPPTAIRDAWAAIQTTLHSCISKQQLRAVTT